MFAWFDAVRLNSVLAYEAFLARYPNSDLAPTAKRLEERARELADEANSFPDAVRIAEKPEIRTVIKEVPVEKLVTKEVIKEVPVEVIKEVKVPFEVIKEVPVEKIVTKEVIKEVRVPVEKIVVKEVRVPVEKIVIKEVKVPVRIPCNCGGGGDGGGSGKGGKGGKGRGHNIPR